MSTGTTEELHGIGAKELKRAWAWFLGLGIVLIVLGLTALGHAVLASQVVVEVFGWVLLVGGVLSFAHACVRHRWRGSFIELFAGILYTVVGLMFLEHPTESAVALSLLIALTLLIGGAVRIVAAVGMQFQHQGWMLLNGVISLLLGILIWRQFPLSGLWVIGMFVGIDLIFYGWSLVMLGLTARGIPDQAA